MAGQNGCAGVVSVDRGGEIAFARAYGLAHRAHQIPNTVGTRFAIASGSKGLTALTVVSLIKDNALSMSTTARSVLGRDLPLIGGDLTIEHLLAHRSGIGDYLDEEAGHEITDYVLTVPAQDLAATEQYLAVLDGHPAKFPAGERFRYCNSGYVVLARTRRHSAAHPGTHAKIETKTSPEQAKRRFRRLSAVPIGGGQGQDRTVDLPLFSRQVKSSTAASGLPQQVRLVNVLSGRVA